MQIEELKERILDLEQAREREHTLRLESDAILEGVKIICSNTDSGAAFVRLLNVLRSMVGAEHAFVLVKNEAGQVRAVASTLEAIVALNWNEDALFARVFAGQSALLYDVEKSVEWRGVSSELPIRVASAIHVPLPQRSGGMLVCVAAQPAFFRREHAQTLERFVPLVMQVLDIIEMNERLAREIDVRMQTETRLWSAHNLLECVLDSSPLGVFWKDVNSVYLGCNQRFAIMAQAGTPADVIGKTDLELWPDPRSERFRDEDREIMRTGIPLARSLEQEVTVQGRMLWVEKSKFPMRNASGAVIGIMGVVEDVSERVLAEEKKQNIEAHLREIQKLESLGIMAGGIAHDFNNLLTTIIGNADMALFDVAEDSPVREFLQEIMKAAQRATVLCEKMRACSGRSQYVLEKVDLATLVHESRGQIQSVLPAAGQAEFIAGADPVPVQVDGTQIRQAMLALLANAFEALEGKPGTVRVRTGRRLCSREMLAKCKSRDFLPDGEYAFLTVEDNGAGMDEEVLTRAFEPFFSTKAAGRGLGLPAVHGVLRGHKGAVCLESTPKSGTLVTLLFPLFRDDSLLQVADETGKSRGTILLVDDDPAVLKVGQKTFESLGFSVLGAAGGSEAIRLFRELTARKSPASLGSRALVQNIVAIVLDLNMPGMGGEATFRELVRLGVSVPVFFSSGFDAAPDLAGEFAGGIAGFIKKPYVSGELVRHLRGLSAPRREKDATHAGH
jgi:PAS domain S-box-containing protein